MIVRVQYDWLMVAAEEEIIIKRPEPPLDDGVSQKLRQGLESCPDVAFAHLCDVEVVGGDHRSAMTLFVWLVPDAMRSLRMALNLVSEVIAKALPEDRFIDVAILNSAPELLQDVERADCLFVVRDVEEQRRALAAASDPDPGVDDEPETSRRWWWPF
jgi:hypothetical protein